MALGSEFAKGYNSFSGVDIKAVFANKVMAELQGISYSITREKAPLYTMGSADPRSFSRGKRGIAGTLIFLVFDRHALLGTFGTYASVDSQMKFLSDKDDVRPESRTAQAANDLTVSQLTGSVGAIVQDQESGLTTQLTEDQEVVAPWFSDQLPPFDITLAAANEYGSLAVMRIYGVEILNEGSGMSIDDIVTEQQMTYVARTIVGWRPVAEPGLQSQLSATSSVA